MDHFVHMLNPVIRLEEIKSIEDMDLKTIELDEHKKAVKALMFHKVSR